MDPKTTAYTTALDRFNPWQQAMWKLLFEQFGDIINNDLISSAIQPRLRLALKGGGIAEGWLICATEDGGLRLGDKKGGKYATTTDVDFSQVVAVTM